MAIEFDIIQMVQKTIKEVNYNNVIFHVQYSGSVHMSRSDEYFFLFESVIKGGMTKIIIDMKDLEYIDSTGIGVIINAAKLIRSKGGDLILLNVSDEINKILKILNFERFIKMYEEYDEAVNFFRYVI